MERKLLPPSGIKPPQFRRPENILTPFNIQEAPSRLVGRRDNQTFVPPRLKRRSKSVTDLRRPLTLDMLMNTASAPKKPGTTVTHKRPLEPLKSNDGCTKAKVAKKIPSWDYKSRFNALNDKYQTSQNTVKELTAKIGDYDSLKARNLITENELEQTKLKIDLLNAENSSLKLKCMAYNKLEEEIATLQGSVLKYKSDWEACLAEKNDIVSKYEHAVKDLANTRAALNASELEIPNLKETIIKYQLERRVLHNMIQNLKGNIRVFCRVRPALSDDSDSLLCKINYSDDHSLEISKQSINPSSGKSEDFRNEFTFDKVFAQNASQEEIFEELSQLVQSALDGFDVCVFAYGQTGSGKTYTMQGGEGATRGMIPRTSYLIFEHIEYLSKSGWEYSVEVSFLEVYNEIVRDLLNLHGHKKMDIYYNEGKGTTVTNLTIQPVQSAAELAKYIAIAHNYRTTAATNFNAHSSRSHAVTKIYITGINKDHGIAYKGSINLVDLAGSESAKHSLSDGRLQETKNINKSLSTLGDVMYALCNKNEHIPYRNSKLTYLLQSSLGGNSKTLMIVNISPFSECFRESLQSLRFAAKVKEVKTVSKRNKSNLVL